MQAYYAQSADYGVLRNRILRGEMNFESDSVPHSTEQSNSSYITFDIYTLWDAPTENKFYTIIKKATAINYWPSEIIIQKQKIKSLKFKTYVQAWLKIRRFAESEFKSKTFIAVVYLVHGDGTPIPTRLYGRFYGKLYCNMLR